MPSAPTSGTRNNNVSVPQGRRPDACTGTSGRFYETDTMRLPDTRYSIGDTVLIGPSHPIEGMRFEGVVIEIKFSGLPAIVVYNVAYWREQNYTTVNLFEWEIADKV